MPQLPGERDLRSLARQFDDVERRVRALVAEAVGESSRRRVNLTEALELLTDLRRQDFRQPVHTAYRAANMNAPHTSRARNIEADNSDRVRDLAGALALKLDRGAQRAAEGSRRAFSRATPDNLEDAQLEAVTAHKDVQGQRWALGRYADTMTRTLGRQASTLGTVDAMGEGLVVVDGSSNDGICGPLIGLTFPATSAPQPPFHVGCECALSPA